MNKKLFVSAGIVERNGKILIAKRKKGKCLEPFWEFPGGKLEEGETIKECLKRELLEELNIKVKVKDFLCSTEFNCNEKNIKLMAYTADYIEGKIQLNDHDDVKWVEKQDLNNFEFVKADKVIVEKLLQK